MEYFGYKKAGEAIDKSFIDWAGVTKTISDEIRGTLDKRQEQRNQLEQDHLDRLKKLNEFEAGVDPSLNTHLLRGAQQYRDYLLANHKQMKAGLISVDDAKIKNQNAMDGFTFYKQTIDSLGANVAALAEAEGKGNEAVAQEIAQIMNFGRNSIVPDMNTGEPYLVPKNEDGSLNMDAARPLRALPNIVGQKFAFVDVESTTDKIAGSAGTWKQTFASGASIEDARQNPNYQKWIDNTITSNLNNDEKLASVLMDYLGMDYTTGDEDGKIKVSFDRSTGRLKPQLTDAQRKQARDAFQESIEAKIGATRTQEKLTADERLMKDLTSNIDKFVASGNISFLNTALKKAGYIGSEATDDGLFLLKPDGGKTKVDITTGMSADQIGRELASKIGIDGYDRYSKVEGGQPSDAIYSKEIYGTFEEAAPKTMSTKEEQSYADMFVFQDRNGTPYSAEQLAQAKQSALGAFKDYLSKTGRNPAGLSMDPETGVVTYGTQDLGNITDGFFNLKTALTGNQGGGQAPNKAPR
jgi:hypothetical protein